MIHPTVRNDKGHEMIGSTWTGYWKPQTATARPPVSAEESQLRARVAELERDADDATKQRAGEAYYAAYDAARAEGLQPTNAARAAYRARIAVLEAADPGRRADPRSEAEREADAAYADWRETLEAAR